MSAYLEARLEKDTQFLNSFFSNVEHMDGTVIILENEKGYEQYKRIIGDPMKEETLIIGDDMDRVILFFNHSPHVIYKCIWTGVTVVSCFSYDKSCFMHKKCKPVNVPHHLQTYVFGGIEETFNSLTLVPPGDKKEPENIFFVNNYDRGGMIPLKEMKKNKDWKKEYESLIEVKLVHMCKSCGSKAYKGCCSEYSPSNRVKLKMVIGWH